MQVVITHNQTAAAIFTSISDSHLWRPALPSCMTYAIITTCC